MTSDLGNCLNVFFRKLQNYHWNIHGESFFRIHEKLEEYYDDVAKDVDSVHPWQYQDASLAIRFSESLSN